MGHIKPSKPLILDSRLVKPERIHVPVSVSFRHAVCGGDFCLSSSTPDEVRGVIDCLRQLTTMTWYDVLRSGGKGGGKAGLGYEAYSDSALKRASRPDFLSKELKISGIRASQKYRVFGFYHDHIFHILWFDRNHDIVPV